MHVKNEIPGITFGFRFFSNIPCVSAFRYNCIVTRQIPIF